MKHAKGTYKIEEYQDDLEYVDDQMAEKESSSGLRLLKLLINVPIIFIIIYLYNRYISTVDQLPQSIGNIIY